jgi:putative ABC transport system ATP-binding protein
MILSVNDLSHEYTQGHNKLQILKDLKLELQNGETLSIMGKSGSGKSTLLNLLAGLMRPTSGEVNIMGQSFSTLSDKKRTKIRGKNLGVIFQQFHLLPHLTAIENITFAGEINNIDEVKQKASNLLERVGLSDRESHFPHELSGGEMQRVAVARALITSPRIILADEPSGSLDEKNAKEIIDLIFELVDEKKTSLIFVTHDEDLSKRCSRSLILDGGVLRERD